MENNIFIKNKKYNPDIAKNYSKVISERNNAKYDFKDEFMSQNSIAKNNDIYKKDKPSDKMDLLMKQKLNERKQQEFEFKPSKNTIPTSNPNDFKEYSDLKVQQVKYEDKNKNNSNNFNSILSDLEVLGILNSK